VLRVFRVLCCQLVELGTEDSPDPVITPTNRFKNSFVFTVFSLEFPVNLVRVHFVVFSVILLFLFVCETVVCMYLSLIQPAAAVYQ